MQRDNRVDGGGVERQPMRDVAGLERSVQQRLEPATRDDHRAPPANCARNRTSLSNSSRMSGIPWRVIAMRSGPMPHANPVYRSLSTPQFSSTAGCTMPEPRISIHPVCLQVAQPPPPPPLPPPIWHCTSLSAAGSVNGENDGPNRPRGAAGEKRRADAAGAGVEAPKV